MKADTLTLKQVFSKNIRYVVPMFQRPYVWNKSKHWEPLWQDVRTTTERLLRSLSDSGVANPAQAEEQTVPHFFGAVVVDHIAGQVVDVEARHVIDGQQRLTTLQLLLDAVQQVVAEHGSDRDARLLAKLILNDPDVITKPDDRFKVWPTSVDQAAFRDAMDDDSDASIHGESPIAKAHRFFVAEAESWITEGDDPEQRGSALSSALHGLFQLVVIDLEPHDNAQVIFETLNARGTPLLAADLVKNHVLQAAINVGLDAESLYRNHWETFDGPYWRHDVKQGRVVRPRVDMFLDFWLELQSGDEVPSHDVFPAFRRHLKAANNDVAGVVAAIDRDSGVYRELHSLRDHSPEGTFLYRWDALEAQVITPLLLWFFAQPDDALPAEQRRLALKSLESYLVRKAVTRRTAKNYNRLFLEALSEVKSGDLSTAGTRLTEFLAAQTADANVWPDDVEFASALIREPLYKQLKRARLRVVLEALEDDLRSPKSEDEHISRGSLTIEHLMPQAWTEAAWPLAGEDDAIAESLRRNRLLHSLGNLTLVTNKLNPELSNGPWSHKRPRIEEHGVLRLHTDFKQIELWNEDEIANRSATLAERAVQLWPHPNSATPAFDEIANDALTLRRTAEASQSENVDSGSDEIGLSELIQEEVLEPGEKMIHPVPSKGLTFEADLDEDGTIVLSTGERFSSPSGASRHIYQRASNGWKHWRVPRLGNQRLNQIRNEYIATAGAETDDD